MCLSWQRSIKIRARNNSLISHPFPALDIWTITTCTHSHNIQMKIYSRNVMRWIVILGEELHLSVQIINHSIYWLQGIISWWQQWGPRLQQQETLITTLQRYASCRPISGRVRICTRKGVRGKNLWIFQLTLGLSMRFKRLHLLSTLSSNQMTFK